MVLAHSFKSLSHLLLIGYFRVRERTMFDSRWSASVVVSASNEYCFTNMVNVRIHGLFSQNRVKSTKYNKHINSLPSVAGKITQSHFALLKNCACAISRYVRCYFIACLIDWLTDWDNVTQTPTLLIERNKPSNKK